MVGVIESSLILWWMCYTLHVYTHRKPSTWWRRADHCCLYTCGGHSCGGIGHVRYSDLFPAALKEDAETSKPAAAESGHVNMTGFIQQPQPIHLKENPAYEPVTILHTYYYWCLLFSYFDRVWACKWTKMLNEKGQLTPRGRRSTWQEQYLLLSLQTPKAQLLL